MQVNYDTYKLMNFTCSKCGWRGKGEALSHGDFSESFFISNLECPKCFELIAFWQVPLSEKSNNNNNIDKLKLTRVGINHIIIKSKN